VAVLQRGEQDRQHGGARLIGEERRGLRRAEVAAADQRAGRGGQLALVAGGGVGRGGGPPLEETPRLPPREGAPHPAGARRAGAPRPRPRGAAGARAPVGRVGPPPAGRQMPPCARSGALASASASAAAGRAITKGRMKNSAPEAGGKRGRAARSVPAGKGRRR